jgi:hypothetical protein
MTQVTIEQVESNINIILDGAATGAFDRWTSLQVCAGLVRTHIAPMVDLDGGWRAARAYYAIRDRMAPVGQIRG